MCASVDRHIRGQKQPTRTAKHLYKTDASWRTNAAANSTSATDSSMITLWGHSRWNEQPAQGTATTGKVRQTTHRARGLCAENVLGAAHGRRVAHLLAVHVELPVQLLPTWWVVVQTRATDIEI